MRKLGLMIGLAAMLAAPAGAAEVAEAFRQANARYEARDFAGAAGAYEDILKSGTASAQLYYNLGNAYFKQGDVGRAVLNYLRAQRLDPRDEDIRHNLEFARQFARVKMEGVELNPISSFFASLVGPVRLNLLAWTSSALFALFCAMLAIRYGLGFRGGWVRLGVVAALVLATAAAGLTTYKYRTEYLTRRVVVVADESPVYNGPTANADVEFQGAPGLVAEVLGESGAYLNVLFENKRRGWVRRDLVAEV
ncbi:MAG: tetratricopeptide repeat protein [candidate division Zixibacteria bacterium]|nr:tetratricopeptide repeat protein [candidate division Zixibacteria bacterium]